MKALLLNGTFQSKEADSYEQLIIEKAKNAGFDIENIKVSDYPMHYCVGCFNCWFVTPGECVFNDYGRELAKRICQSDLLIIFSPVTFGSYSSYAKKIIDRCIPLTLPFIVTIGSREYHKKRYSKLPNFFGIGIMSEDSREEEKIFGELIKRNAANFISKFSGSTIINAKATLSEAEKKLEEAFKEIGAWK